MELESCRKCVYHIVDDEAEVSCVHSDGIDHRGIVKRDDGSQEVTDCPKERAV